MKRFILALLILSPLFASAHEQRVYEINGMRYQFVVGSHEEPVYVDEMAGVEIRIGRLGALEGHEAHHGGVLPGAIEGLERTLKVELVKGDTRKTIPLSASYEEPGKYEAPYIPTEEGELTYRIVGQLDDFPINIPFACAPAGHEMEGKEDASRLEVAEGIVRVSKKGSFGCPEDKADLGFPHDFGKYNGEDEGTDWVAMVTLASALATLVLILRRRP